MITYGNVDNDFTDNEIIKAWEKILKTGDAPIGEHWSVGGVVTTQLAKDTYDTFTRQKAKIAVLSVENANLKISIEGLKADNSFLTEAIASADAPSPIVSRLIQENNEKHMNIVNGLKAEIEQYKKNAKFIEGKCDSILKWCETLNFDINIVVSKAIFKAIKVFAERLKEKSPKTITTNISDTSIEERETGWVKISDIDNLLQEMVGDEDA